MALRLTTAAALLLLGLYAGGVVFTVLAPRLLALPGPAYVRHWQALNHDYGRAMPPLLLTCTALLIAVSVLSASRGWAVTAPAVVGTVLVVGTIVLTLVAMEPLNRVADSWDPDALPADWSAVRDAWARWHVVRTVLAVAAFGCVLVSQVAAGQDAASSTPAASVHQPA